MGKSYKIYTKGGDKGETSLLGGTRVPKYHLRIQAYGTIDELKSYLPLIYLNQTDSKVSEFLSAIQEKLFRVEALLASEKETIREKLPQIYVEDVETLEKEIDLMNEYLPELKNFIMPGGSTSAVHAHVSRCICRRAERIVIELSENEEVDALIIQYLNRLSDYLFVLARFLCKYNEGCNESIWKA